MGYSEFYGTENNLNDIDFIRKKHYSVDDLVPQELYRIVINRQPFSTVLLSLNEMVLGYYTLIGLNEDIYQKMVKGDIDEKNLNQESSIPIIRNEAGYKDRYIYILSVATTNLSDSKANAILLFRLKNRIRYMDDNLFIKGTFAQIINEKLKQKVYADPYIKNIIKI